MANDNKILIESLEKISEVYSELEKIDKERSEQFWNSFSLDQKLDLFCAVVRRIHKGELEDQGSYRYVLYQVFGFQPDSYVRGMDCGYLTLHNSIYTEQYEKDLLIKFTEKMFGKSGTEAETIVEAFFKGK